MAIFDDVVLALDKNVFGRMERFLDDVLLLPEEVRTALEAGEAALTREDFDSAEGYFLEVMATRPNLGRAAIGLAQARQGLGDPHGTLAALLEARALAPEDGHLALWAARVALEAGETEEARSAAKVASRALALEGGDAFADACATLAWAEWHAGRADRAVRELRKAISVRDRNDLRAALVAALVDAGDVGGARAAAVALKGRDLEAQESMRVGDALLRAGDGELAKPFLQLAADDGRSAAAVGLAQIALRAGEIETSESLARQAIATGAGLPAVLLLAEVLVAAGDNAGAAEAYEAAAEMSGPKDAPESYRKALRVVPIALVEPMLRYAGALVESSEHAQEGLADAANIFASIASDREIPSSAHDALKESVEPRVLLAAALSAETHGQSEESLVRLEAFELAATRQIAADEDHRQAAKLRRTVLRQRWIKDGEVDLAAVIDAALAFGDTHGLDALSRGAARLRDELDRPLLLGVLGEFNAGKSTLINAFIGTDVAPMGIVPTTATLNLLRDGAEKMVRVVFRDGRTREGSYEALRPMLKELEALGAKAEGASAIDRVEILLPSEQLQRVWLLDSPGTNALDAAHEKLAQEAARRADAVMWIFDAAQAGKLSETRIHAQLKAQGRVVIPILNKRDRLKPGELAEVSAVIEKGFGARPAAISAKAALKARIADDADAFEASGFPALLSMLDTQVFSRSRVLKRGACGGRLSILLDEAIHMLAQQAEDHERDQALAKEKQEALDHKRVDVLLAVDDALRLLSRDLDAAFRAAVDEVFSFVRPRRSRFAKKGVHPEDRVFLRGVLERRVTQALRDCERRLRARLAVVLTELSTPTGLDKEWLAGVLRPAFAGFRGYQRGRLDGGAVDRFFDEHLRSNELDREVVRRALFQVRADEREELRPRLQEACTTILVAMSAGHQRRQEDADQQAKALRIGVIGFLQALQDVLGAVRSE